MLGRIMQYNVTVQHQLDEGLHGVSGLCRKRRPSRTFFGNGPNYNLNQASYRSLVNLICSTAAVRYAACNPG